MRRYPEYKESSVKWIGEIPKDWEIKKIKYMQSNLIGGVWGNEPEGNENDIYCVRVADFNYVQLAISTYNLTLRNIPLTERNKRILRTNDLLVEKSGGGEKSPVGRTVIFDAGIPRRSVTSNFISKFTAKSDSCFSRYLLYCLSFLYQIGLTRKHIKQSTGLQNLDIDSYFQERIPFPSLIEQTQIAAFLDHKTGQIDELIRIKERRIELLQEQRTALINQAVTKGLDLNVEMKSSGVEWIGEIPKHWTISKVKHEFESLDNLRIPLNSETRGNMKLKIYDYYGASGVIDKVENCIFDEPLILIGEDGANLYLRSTPLAFKATGKYWVNNHAHVLRPKHGNIDYLTNMLESLDYIHYITGAAQPKLTSDNLMNITVITPPPLEQDRIANFLDRKAGQIDQLITAEQRKIELLKEYRQSLISEAVTGKIDVRNEV